VKDYSTPSPYYTYMLRFWPESQESEEPRWCYTLLDPKTGEQQGFATLESLVKYLASLTEEIPGVTGDTP